MFFKEKAEVKLQDGHHAEAEAKKYAFLETVEVPNAKG